MPDNKDSIQPFLTENWQNLPNEDLMSGNVLSSKDLNSMSETVMRNDRPVYQKVEKPIAQKPLSPVELKELKDLKLKLKTQNLIQGLAKAAGDPYADLKERSVDLSSTGSNMAKYYSFGKTFNKYGFSPYADNEAIYNANSGWYENWSRSTTGLMKAAVPSYISMLPWNAWDDSMKDIKGSVAQRDNHMIYGDTRKGVMPFINNLKIDFGMTAGIIGEIATEEAAIWVGSTLLAPETLGASWAAAIAATARNISRAKKVFSATEWTAKLASTAKKYNAFTELSALRKVYNLTVKPLEYLGKGTLKVLIPQTATFGADVYKNFKKGNKLYALANISHGFGAFYRDSRAIAAGRAESKMEASNVYTDVIQNRLDAIRKEGREPTENEYKDMYTAAGAGAVETFNYNLPALILSNHIVLPKAMRGWKGMKALGLEAEQQYVKHLAAEKSWWKAVGKTPWSVVKDKTVVQNLKSLTKLETWKPKNILRTGLKSIGKFASQGITEGLQENYQEIVSGTMKDYYSSIHNSPVKAGYNDKLGLWGDNYRKQFSEQGLKTFASGFFMGGLAYMPQHVLFTTIPKQFTQIHNKFSPKAKAEYDANEVVKEKWKKDTLDIWNAVSKNPFKYFFNADSRFAETTNKSNAADTAAMNNDKYAFENANFETILDHLDKLYSEGQVDVLLDSFHDMQQLPASELKEAYGDIEGTDEEVKAYYDKKFEAVFETAKVYDKRYKLTDETFINPFNPRKYSDKESTEFKIEATNYIGYNQAKKHIVYAGVLFDDALNRMKSVMDKSILNKAVGKAPASAFSILFDNVPGSMAGMQSELKVLAGEITSLNNGTAEDKKLAKQKEILFDALFNLSTSINHFQNVLDLDHLQDVDITSKSTLEKLVLMQQGATVKTAKGTTVVIDKVVGEYAYIKEDGKTKRIKRKNLELVKIASNENELDWSNNALKQYYKEYLEVIANQNNDFVFDENIESGFLNLRDFYRLKHDSSLFAKSVNTLHNPEYFNEYAQRIANIHLTLHDQRIVKNKEIYDLFFQLKDTNDLLTEIFKMGVYIDPEDIPELINNAVIPTKFYDTTTYESIIPTSQKYKEVIDLIENWKEFVGKTVLKPIVESEEAPEGVDTRARPKFKSDTRTHKDIGDEYNFDINTEETSLELAFVLQKIIDSKYSSKREKNVARRFLLLAQPGLKIIVKNNLNKPGIYDATNDRIVVDARYTSSDYKGSNFPFEHVLIHEIVHKFTVQGYKTDAVFKAKIDELYAIALNAYNNKLSVDGKPYGLTNQLEFISESISNDRFQAFLGTITYKNTTKTLWQEFLGSLKMFLSRALGISTENTLLEEVIGVITTKIDSSTNQNLNENKKEIEEAEVVKSNLITWQTPNIEMPKELLDEIIAAFNAYKATFTDEEQEPTINIFKRYGEGKDIINAYNEKNKTSTGVKPVVPVSKKRPITAGRVDVVGDAEYKDFIDKGIVSEVRLNDIANKVKNQEPLSDREKEIFSDKTGEINKIIATKTGSGVDAKADIERRRQEELNKKNEQGYSLPMLIKDREEALVRQNKSRDEAIAKGIKDLAPYNQGVAMVAAALNRYNKSVKEINAKYDAELAALDNTADDKVVKTVKNITPEQAKVLETIKVLKEKNLIINSNNKDEYINTYDEDDIFARVSTIKGKFPEVGDAADRGIIIDDLFRAFIADEITTLEILTAAYKAHPKKQTVKLFKPDFIKNLFDIFNKVKNFAEKENLILISDKTTLWGILNGEKYAGTIDLLGIAPNGSVYIIDLKTSTQNRRWHYEMTTELKKLAGIHFDNIMTKIKNKKFNNILDVENFTEDEKVITDKFIEKFEKYSDPDYNSLSVYPYQKEDSIQQSAYAELLRQRTGINIQSITVFPIQVSRNYSKAFTNEDVNKKLTLIVSVDRSLFPEQSMDAQSNEIINASNAKINAETEAYEGHMIDLTILEEKIDNGAAYDQKEFQDIENRILKDIESGIIESKEYRDILDSVLKKIQDKFITFKSLSIGDYVIFASNPTATFVVATRTNNKIEVYNTSIKIEDWKNNNPEIITRKNMHNVKQVIKPGAPVVEQTVSPEEKEINKGTVDAFDNFLKNDELINKLMVDSKTKSVDDIDKDFNDITGCEL